MSPSGSWKQEAKIGLEPLKAARGPLPAYDKMRAEAKGLGLVLAQTGIFRLPRHSRDESSCFDFGVEAMFVAQFRSLHGVSTLPCLGSMPDVLWLGPTETWWPRNLWNFGGQTRNRVFKRREESLGFDFHENHDISTTLVHF